MGVLGELMSSVMLGVNDVMGKDLISMVFCLEFKYLT